MRCCHCHPTLQQLSPLSPLVWQRRSQILAPCLSYECERGASWQALFFPLFGAPKPNTSNNREGWCALALGGNRFNETHNNQMQDGFHVTVDVGEDALPGQSVWGDVVSLLGVANSTTTKN
jgi:hypothetical protein